MLAFLIVCIAIGFAAAYGFNHGARSMGHTYKNKRDKAARRGLSAEAIAGGEGARSVGLGTKAGAVVGASIGGWGLAFRAFRHGWTLGYPKGQKWTIDTVDRLRGRAPVGDTTDGAPDPAPPVKPTEVKPEDPRGPGQSAQDTDRGKEAIAQGRCPWDYGPRLCYVPVKPGSLFCPKHTQPEPPKPAEQPAESPAPASAPAVQPQPAAPPAPSAPTKGAAAMPIETATGGEVLTKEQFVKEMNAKIAEEQSELEDAQVAAKRAKEDCSRVEVMAASMSHAEVTQGTVIQVRALADTNAAALQVAQQRVSISEQRIAIAKEALRALDQSKQNQFYAG